MANPLQYSYLENPTDRRPCQTTVPGVAESDTTGATWHAPGILMWGEGRRVSRTWAGGDGLDAPQPLFGGIEDRGIAPDALFLLSALQMWPLGFWSIFCP